MKLTIKKRLREKGVMRDNWAKREKEKSVDKGKERVELRDNAVGRDDFLYDAAHNYDIYAHYRINDAKYIRAALYRRLRNGAADEYYK